MRKIPCLLPTATLTNGYQLSGWRETQTYCISGVRGPTWASLGQGQSVSRAALPLEAEGETPFAGLSQQLATASFPGLRLSVLKASRQPSQPLSDCSSASACTPIFDSDTPASHKDPGAYSRPTWVSQDALPSHNPYRHPTCKVPFTVEGDTRRRQGLGCGCLCGVLLPATDPVPRGRCSRQSEPAGGAVGGGGSVCLLQACARSLGSCCCWGLSTRILKRFSGSSDMPPSLRNTVMEDTPRACVTAIEGTICTVHPEGVESSCLDPGCTVLPAGEIPFLKSSPKVCFY